MGIRIESIDIGSFGEEVGLRSGDTLMEINGDRIQDVLDFRYAIADDVVELLVEREGEAILFEIEKETDDSLGLNFDPIKVRMCGNDCPFCFVDQNPANMRKSLYFRDEDFRLSFLAGHFVTLTNISKRDLDRIVRQRLTPLYISVHAIDWEIRKFLLGLKKDDRLLQKLSFLTEHGIELHTQIVICPGFNDGAILEETVTRLAEFYPNVGSIALVPLGLTRHREGLTPLKPITPEFARELLQHADRLAEHYKQKLDKYFVYPSDEFYIISGEAIPERERYDEFEQFENGVGMVRTLIEDFEAMLPDLPTELAEPKSITLVTGTLMGNILQAHVVDKLNRIANLHVELAVIRNRFYGETIRVSGLLTGQDIFEQLKERDNGDVIYLPENCTNDDAVFLDDWRLEELSTRLDTRMKSMPNDFSLIFDDLAQMEKVA